MLSKQSKNTQKFKYRHIQDTAVAHIRTTSGSPN